MAVGTADVSVNGIRVQVDSQGAGPEFVLIHSLLTGAEAFEQVASKLESSYRLHRISLPGFGRSEVLPDSDPSIEDLADHVAAVMAALECGPSTTVLGNGFGGFIAASLAITHGTKFGDLVLANCGSVFTPERSAAFDTMSRLVTENGMEAVVQVAVRRTFPEAYLESHPHLIDERAAVLRTIDPGAFAASCGALGKLDLTSSLITIANRTLVIAAEDDGATPPEMADTLAAGIGGATHVVLEECGHCPQLQRPEALLAALSDFGLS